MTRTHPLIEFHNLMQCAKETKYDSLERIHICIRILDVILYYGQQEKYRQEILKKNHFKLFRTGRDKSLQFSNEMKGKYKHVFYPYISKFENFLSKYDPDERELEN